MLVRVLIVVMTIGLCAAANADIDVKLMPGFGVGESELFPAYILSKAGDQPEAIGSPGPVEGHAVQIINESPDMHLGFGLMSDKDSAVKVSIKFSKFAAETQWAGKLKAGVVYFVYPLVQWDFDALNRNFQPSPVFVTLNVTSSADDPISKTSSLKVRAVTDVPYGYMAGEKYVNLSPTFAAFVNENHPWIDSLLKEAIDTGLIQQFDGYQSGDPLKIRYQVFAVWNVMQRHGIHYSSITTPSGASEVVFSQTVRFLDQAIGNSQANCVDGTVLFASVLRKIGIHPVLAMIPGHMFLGYYTDKDDKQIEFLETTMLGMRNLKNYSDDSSLVGGLSRLMGGATKATVSADTFNAATQQARKEANAVWNKFRVETPGYMLIDIDAARSAGINPINFPAAQ